MFLFFRDIYVLFVKTPVTLIAYNKFHISVSKVLKL